MSKPPTKTQAIKPGRYTIRQVLDSTKTHFRNQDWARSQARGKPFPGDKGLVYDTRLTMQKAAKAPDGRIRFQTTTYEPESFGVDKKGRFPRKWDQYVELPFDYDKNNVRGERKWRAYCTCLTADTRVLTTNGWKTMLELADINQDPDKDFTVDYVVNGKTYRGTAPYRTGNKTVLKITLDNGYVLKGTKDHLALTYKGYDSNTTTKKRKGIKVKSKRWVKLGDLKIGSLIMQNDSGDLIPTTDTHSSTYKDSYFAGAFYGDGTYNPFSIAIHSHYGMIDRLAECDPDIMWEQSKGRFLLNQTGKEILARYGMTKENRHKIPTNCNLYGFLSGLLDTDGYVRHDGGINIYGRLALKDLADQLIAVGIHGVKLRVRKPKGHTTNFGTRNHDFYDLKISAQGMRQIRKNIRSIKYSLLEDKPTLQRRANVAKVVKIERGGKQPVYDITVPGISRFVAESVIVHNCPRYKFTHHWVLWNSGHAPKPHGKGLQAPDWARRGTRGTGFCKHLTLAMLAINKLSRQNKLPELLPDKAWVEIEKYWQRIESGNNAQASLANLANAPDSVRKAAAQIAKDANRKSTKATPNIRKSDFNTRGLRIPKPNR